MWLEAAGKGLKATFENMTKIPMIFKQKLEFKSYNLMMIIDGSWLLIIVKNSVDPYQYIREIHFLSNKTLDNPLERPPLFPGGLNLVTFLVFGGISLLRVEFLVTLYWT